MTEISDEKNHGKHERSLKISSRTIIIPMRIWKSPKHTNVIKCWKYSDENAELLSIDSCGSSQSNAGANTWVFRCAKSSWKNVKKYINIYLDIERLCDVHKLRHCSEERVQNERKRWKDIVLSTIGINTSGFNKFNSVSFPTETHPRTFVFLVFRSENKQTNPKRCD